MKKFVFTLLLVFVCHLGYAQSINGLFNEFGSEKNADCVKVSSFMMSLVNQETKKKHGRR